MVENNRTAKSVIQNYRQYIPRELKKRYWWFVRRRIKKHIENITYLEHDAE
jgi:hypothetical protein